MQQRPASRKIWKMPLILAALTLFGLLSALLGTGIWYPLSWCAMIVPVATILWYLRKSLAEKSRKRAGA